VRRQGRGAGRRGREAGRGDRGDVSAKDVPVSFEFVAQTQSSRQVNIQAA